MPKQLIKRTGNNSFADVMVRWSKPDEAQTRGGDARVDLFMVSLDGLGNLDGSFWFEPKPHHGMYQSLNAEQSVPLGGDGVNVPSNMCGPVHVDLNREQINRLIRTLRTARDQAYGRDE